MDLQKIKDDIYSLIKSKEAVSYVELSREISGFKGEMEHSYKNPNIILWGGVSEKAAKALNELMAEQKIYMTTSSVLVYLVDGVIPRLPVAKRPNYAYRKPHWLPVIFWTKEHYKTLIAPNDPNELSLENES